MVAEDDALTESEVDVNEADAYAESDGYTSSGIECDEVECNDQAHKRARPESLREIPIQGPTGQQNRSTATGGASRTVARNYPNRWGEKYNYRSAVEKALQAKVDVPAELLAGLLCNVSKDPAKAGRKLSELADR